MRFIEERLMVEFVKQYEGKTSVAWLFVWTSSGSVMFTGAGPLDRVGISRSQVWVTIDDEMSVWHQGRCWRGCGLTPVVCL